MKINERKSFVDIAKGLGILMVMYSHSLYHNDTMMLYVSGCFIPLFFVVSGYLISTDSLFRGGYLLHKCKALLCPYFVFNILFAFAILLRQGNIAEQDVLGVLYSRFCLYPMASSDNVLLMNMQNSPTWFLTAMFVALVLYQLLMRNERYRSYLFILYLLTVVFMKRLPILLPWSIDTAPLLAVFMYAGYLIREKQILEQKSTYFVPVVFVAYYVLCYVNGMVNVSVREYNSTILLLFTGIIGSFLILKISQFLERYLCKFSVPLMMIGKDSLYIFCTHVFVFSIFGKVFGSMCTSEFSFIFLLIDFIGAVILGIFVSKFFRKVAPCIFRK